MTEHWNTALVALGSGVGVGLVASFTLGRGAARRRKAGKADDLLDLAARQEVTLARLRELDAGHAAFSPEAVAAERKRLELEAARALRDLELGREARAPRPAPRAAAESTAEATAAVEPDEVEGSPEAPRSSAMRHPWLWGIGSAAFAAAVIVGLRSFTMPRVEGASMTGDNNTGAPAQPMKPGDHPEESGPLDPQVAVLKAQLEKDPGNEKIQLDLADAYLKTISGSFEGFQLAKKILDKDPDNSRALVQEATVRSLIGQQQQALQLTEHALTKDPKFVNGWIELGRIAMAANEGPSAVQAFQKAIELDPSRAADLQDLIAQARNQLAPPAPEENNGPAATAAPPAAGSAIQGTIDMDPAVAAKLPPGGVIFLIARTDSSGPRPLAAKRLPAQGFPISFSLSDADAVMGGSLPDHVNVEARWDADGNAFSRDPTDPVADQQNVALGTRGVHLVLRAP